MRGKPKYEYFVVKQFQISFFRKKRYNIVSIFNMSILM